MSWLQPPCCPPPPSAASFPLPPAGQTSTLTWSGGPLTGATQFPPPCTSLTCDTCNLTISVPSTFYTTNPNYGVHVGLNWGLDDKNSNLSSGAARTWFVRQTGGPTL